MRLSFQAFKLSSFLLVACEHSSPQTPPPLPPPAPTVAYTGASYNPPPSVPQPVPTSAQPSAIGDTESGLATWYGKVLAGHKTASGERFDPSKMTAAHKTLPLGTWVDVKRRGTNKVVRVRINDRGPFGEADRIIDLSRAAFEHLGSIREGVIPIDLVVVSIPVKK